jgi:HptB-dependent secretion and biofilm anti anti-sigma factor
MPLACNVSPDGKTVRISVGQRFDFNNRREFRDAYEKAKMPNAEYVIDLRDTHYMDSSALGMLLLLRDFAGGDRARISIVNANTEIRNTLDVSNFERLFKIG